MPPTHIRPIAIVVVRHGDRLLVFDHVDSESGVPYSRPLGGGIEPGELSRDAIVREFREETGWELVNIRLLNVSENLFRLGGIARHEIVFLYEADLADPSGYEAGPFTVPDDPPVIGRWRALSDFGKERRLVPEGLLEQLVSRSKPFDN